MRGLGLAKFVAAGLVAAALTCPASAGPVLVSELSTNPHVSDPIWAQDHDQQNMNNVFGSGNWTLYDSYAGATPGSIFTGDTNFVFLEGGVETYSDLKTYLAANRSSILDWVNGGGRLLLMSAGPAGLGIDSSITGFGPGNLAFDEPASFTNCGTLTPDGDAALSFEPLPSGAYCGHSLAGDYVAGDGLTDFMDGNVNGLSIIGGKSYGDGYIMYSGLTDSQFHDVDAFTLESDCLVDDVIAFTAGVAGPGPNSCSGHRTNSVPEPLTLAVFGTGLAGLAASRKRHRRT